MRLSSSEELYAMLPMLLAGAICGLQYDIVRITRVLLRLASYTRAGQSLYEFSFPWIGSLKTHDIVPLTRVRRILIALGDILFAILAGGTFSVTLFAVASGVFRWFYLLAAVVGFLLYTLTLGRVVILSSEIVSAMIRVCVRYAVRTLLLPFVGLARLLRLVGKQACQRILYPVRRAIRFEFRKHYTMYMQRTLPEAVRMSTERSDIS